MTQHNPQPELPTAGTATAFGADCGGDSPSPLVSLDLKCFLICMVGCTTSQRRQRETKRRMLQIAMTFAPKAVKQSNAFGACPKQWSFSKKRSGKEVHEKLPLKDLQWFRSVRPNNLNALGRDPPRPANPRLRTVRLLSHLMSGLMVLAILALPHVATIDNSDDKNRSLEIVPDGRFA